MLAAMLPICENTRVNMYEMEGLIETIVQINNNKLPFFGQNKNIQTIRFPLLGKQSPSQQIINIPI